MRSKALLFIPLALAQLIVPTLMIHQHETVLREGALYKFRTAPIDPRDPFRGEYVTLDLAAESGEWYCPWPSSSDGDAHLFASLGTDSLGFATLTTLSSDAPEAPHLEVTVYSYQPDTSFKIERVSLPFDRFYMEEGEGARAEALMRPRWQDDVRIEPMEAYVLVRVYKGEAVVEDLVVGGKPIREWMKEDVTTE